MILKKSGGTNSTSMHVATGDCKKEGAPVTINPVAPRITFTTV